MHGPDQSFRESGYFNYYIAGEDILSIGKDDPLF